MTDAEIQNAIMQDMKGCGMAIGLSCFVISHQMEEMIHFLRSENVNGASAVAWCVRPKDGLISVSVTFSRKELK